MTPESRRQKGSPEGLVSDESWPDRLSESELREIIRGHGVDVRRILDESHDHGVINGKGPMNWRRLLEPQMPRDICRHWAENVRFWFRDRRTWNVDIRKMLNTYDMPFEKLKDVINQLLREADDVIATYLAELFPGQEELRSQWMVSKNIQDCRDLLKLICLSVYGRFKTKPKLPKPSEKRRTNSSWEARRRLALALLIRSIEQRPEYVNRTSDSSHFEDRVLRDKTGLIKSDQEYTPVVVKFKVKGDSVSIISEQPMPEGMNELALYENADDGSESMVLYKVAITGRRAPHAPVETVEVYAFPGNKNIIDAQDSGLTERERHRIHSQRSIIGYKSLPTIALKMLRGSKEITDFVRGTFLVRTDKDIEKLQSMFDTELGSTVNRQRYGRGDNQNTSHHYKALHLIEAIHYEQEGRNYNVEIRIGLFPQMLLDKSRTHEVGHDHYKVRRSIGMLGLLFPRQFYPEIHEQGAAYARVVYKRT